MVEVLVVRAGATLFVCRAAGVGFSITILSLITCMFRYHLGYFEVEIWHVKIGDVGLKLSLRAPRGVRKKRDALEYYANLTTLQYFKQIYFRSTTCERARVVYKVSLTLIMTL